MTTQSSKRISPNDITISRQTRNAFFTAIIFIFAAIVNFFVSLKISLANPTSVSIADSVVVFSFVIFSIFSAVLIRAGKKDKGVWLLLGSVSITLALRNALTADISIILSLLIVNLAPFIALLTLKPKFFIHAIGLGIFSGAFYLIFDILTSRYLPPYRQLPENVEIVVSSITILVIIIAFLYIITLFRQHRFLLLLSKITLAMIYAVLIPIIILIATGSASLKNSLKPRQEEDMRVKATLVAQNIHDFIRTNKRILQSDAGSSAIVEYLSYLDEYGDNNGKKRLEDQALESLYSFRQKNTFMIESYAILDLSGKNILDTVSENIGNDESEADYFAQPLENNLPFVSDISKTRTSSKYSFYFSAPIRLKNGKVVGVIRAQHHPYVLQQYLNSYMNIEGESNKDFFIALLSEKETKQISPEDPESVYIVFINGKNPELNFKSITPLTTNVITPLQMNRVLPVGNTAKLSLEVPNFDAGLRNRASHPVFEAQAFPRDLKISKNPDIIATADIKEGTLSWIIILSQDVETFNSPIDQQNNTNTILAIIIAIFTAILAYFGSQYLIKPLTHLSNIANKVAAGNLNARAIINTEDEVAMLGNAFNGMAEELESLVSTLETRVTERTQALERNARQVQAAVEVGKSAASLRNLDELLTHATELISEEFDFYHVGIFLIDPSGKYALLKAANSKGGRRMLAQKHKLEVGEEGIVGLVTATGESRIALDVGRDAAFFNNPALPDTRSEMALPLVAGNKIFGALDIQSTEGEAFSEADTTSLQVLADQIAIAIENARLFDESQKALAEARRAYGEQSQLGWQELIHKLTNFGYKSSSDGNIYPLEEGANEMLEQAMQENQTLLDADNLIANIPIMIRGESVGAIQLSKLERAKKWSQQDLDLARTLTAELSRAMDSARLFDETKQQADRERVVGEISNKMRETMNVESVLRLTADELYKLLDLEHITIHLSSDDDTDQEEIL